jgi:hypothetical protein
MSADDHLEPGCGGVEVQLSNVVEDIYQAGRGLGYRCHGQMGRPNVFVDVASNRYHRRDLAKSFDNPRLADISGVDDEVGTF